MPRAQLRESKQTEVQLCRWLRAAVTLEVDITLNPHLLPRTRACHHSNSMRFLTTHLPLRQSQLQLVHRQLAHRQPSGRVESILLSAQQALYMRHAVTRQASTRASGAPGLNTAGSGTRESALAAALRQIESQFGKGSIMQLGSFSSGVAVDVISTGSLALDHALGIGGLPRGRVVEIYGPESSGKTTLALHVVAAAQAAGLRACFIDAEHALDPSYARAVGVDLDSLYLSQPDTGEQALEIADTLVRSGAIDVLVVDSVAALVPKAELEGEMGDHHMALQARLMSQALRKLTSSLSRARTLIIFLNQIRSKVGVIFGSPDVTPGGNALKFYSSVRLEIRRASPIKRGEDIVGSITRVKVAKNKLAPPFRVAEFEMTFGSGIGRAAEAIDLGVAWGIFRKSGAWYSIADAELVRAVNAAQAGAAVGGGGAVAAAAVAAAPIGAAAPRKGGKGSKRESRVAAPPPSPLAVTMPGVAPVESAATAQPVAANLLGLDEPWLQGKERAKAFLDAHASVLAVALARVRLAMRERPAPLDVPVVGSGIVVPGVSQMHASDDNELSGVAIEAARYDDAFPAGALSEGIADVNAPAASSQIMDDATEDLVSESDVG